MRERLREQNQVRSATGSGKQSQNSSQTSWERNYRDSSTCHSHHSRLGQNQCVGSLTNARFSSVLGWQLDVVDVARSDHKLWPSRVPAIVVKQSHRGCMAGRTTGYYYFTRRELSQTNSSPPLGCACLNEPSVQPMLISDQFKLLATPVDICQPLENHATRCVSLRHS